MTKKAIGLIEFELLTQDRQFELLHKDGVHVGKRKLDQQTVILFQLYGFYVEVHYRQYRKIIDHIIASGGAEILQPYLDQIQVRDLDGEGEE